MAMHEKQALPTDEQAAGKTIAIPRAGAKATSSRAAAGTRWLALGAALLGTTLLVAGIRSCQDQHHHHHVAVSGKWASLPALAAVETAWPDAPPPEVEAHRQGGEAGIERRQASSAVAAAATDSVLVVYQVHQPVLTPQGATLDSGVSNGIAGEVEDSCQVVLMDYVFAYSYGAPFVGAYTPPDCEFNRVVMNFTVVSEGRQFDRLALMYFNDTEVWRTSTAEPTPAPGIRWTYLKDMTAYLSLWTQPQKLIFDLGNLIDDTYTGDFNTTLTATFFLDASVDTATAAPADLIIPISARKSAANGVSQFTLPADNATNTIAAGAFPRNAHRAVFTVSATGQSNEEFWWSNLPQSSAATFAASGAGTFPGFSPWREVQVTIDGQLAGVAWPFPVVFTGGVVPSLHRPLVGPDAFDLREREIDVTPFLGVLCDGEEHTFAIAVVGLQDNADGSAAAVAQTVGSSWYVTGKVFVWLDADAESITTGAAPVVTGAEPVIVVSQALTTTSGGNGSTTNETLRYDTAVTRVFFVSATLTRQNGSSSASVGWVQSLSYSNAGYVWAKGYAQINDLVTRGADDVADAAAAAAASYKTEYKYPLYCNTSYSYSAEGNLTIFAELVQGQQVYIEGATVFPDGLEAFAVGGASYAGSLANNTKDGIAYYFRYADGSGSSGCGSTDETLTFGGFTASGGSVDATPDTQLYSRHVAATNSSYTVDDQVLAGTDVEAAYTTASNSVSDSWAAYAQTPLNGGSGAPRLFMNRQLFP